MLMLSQRWACMFTAITAVLALPVSASAQFSLSGFAKPSVEVSTAWSSTAIKPEGHATLAVILEIPEPLHINSHLASAPFIPTTIQVIESPAFLRISTAVFPAPKDLIFNSGTGKASIKIFSEKLVAYIPVALKGSAPPGKSQITLRIGYQACDDKTCFTPAQVDKVVSLEVASPSAEVKPINPELFAGLQNSEERLNIPCFGLDFQIPTSKFWLLLIVAAIGGFFLNLTPCVLPLLPLKMMGLSQAAGNRRRCFLLGLTMSAGVIAFWMALAIAICTISGFNATNKLFQYPAFTVSVGVIICVMAIGMSGLFSLRLPSWIYGINPSHDSALGALLFGIMTAVLSTPCTAPFMGAAAAWSATQPPAITLTTFAVIGVGMAMPYLLLSAFPPLIARVPRTGPASELIKQIMGLLMLAAGAYFLGTGLASIWAEPPDPPSQAYWWFVAIFVLASGLWLLWRTFRITERLFPRLVFGLAGLALFFGAVHAAVRFTRASPIHWIYFTPDRFTKAQQTGKPILLEFTAAWCLNCHALEQGVLHQPEVVKLLNSTNLISMKVDLTGNNNAGDQKLLQAGSRAIPYLVLYSADGSQAFASDAYTRQQVVSALQKAMWPMQ
ncbi:MAG: hypothetical protein JWM16_3673 [Verrucomicrobiales bacterium]|nr:hypothetical protein [Verrucomicrobiales bacterium]